MATPIVPGTPPVAHVGGPIQPPGAPRVLMGRRPSARLAELALCNGPTLPGPLASIPIGGLLPTDVVTQGASSVWVQGMFASRKLDATAHGGVIVDGVDSVRIGGPVYTARAVRLVRRGFPPHTVVQYGSSIFIEPDPDRPDFQERALQAYIRLDSTPNMHRAIDALEASGHTITVRRYQGGAGQFNATTRPDSYADALPRGRTVSFPARTGTGAHDAYSVTGTGRGTSSTIEWDPDVNGFGPPGTTPNADQPGSDVILGHETVHAVHDATGNHGGGPVVPDNTDTQTGEERNTVGLPQQTYNGAPGDPNNGTTLPATSGQPYTENGVRSDYRERGIESPVTGAPPEPRGSYYGGSGSPF